MLYLDLLMQNYFFCEDIVCIGLPPLENTPPLILAKPPPLNLQTVQAPPFLGNPPYILVFREPLPLKLGFFGELQKY